MVLHHFALQIRSMHRRMDQFRRRWPRHGLVRCRLVDSLERPEEAGKVIPVGGPDVLTYRQIAVLAAGAAGVTRPRCTASRLPYHLPCPQCSQHAPVPRIVDPEWLLDAGPRADRVQVLLRHATGTADITWGISPWNLSGKLAGSHLPGTELTVIPALDVGTGLYRCGS